MDRELLRKHFQENQIESYHGINHIDALRNLASNPNVPKVLREMMQQEYDKAIIELGFVRVPNFTENLYKFLNGDEDLAVSEPIEGLETMIYGTKLCVREVKIPYFKKVCEYYYKTHGHSVCNKFEFYVIDLIRDGESLFLDWLKKAKSSGEKGFYVGRGFSSDAPWIMDRIQYVIANEAFSSPYNGIGAKQIPAIAENLTAIHGSDPKIKYVNETILGSLLYYIGDDLRKKYSIDESKEFDMPFRR